MLSVPQKNLINCLWNADHLSISDKIDSIDSILKEMPKEARVEYRKWRFLMDRSRMPDFYNSQNNQIKMIIAAIFEKSTDLEEFAQAIMSIKASLNNPDAFDKWLKNEEIEFKEPPIQKDVKKKSTSQSSELDSFGMVPNAISVPTPYQQQVSQYQQPPANIFGSNFQPVTTTQQTQHDSGSSGWSNPFSPEFERCKKQMNVLRKNMRKK
ncbi:hypothetical protein WR25_14969 [Diploscapter pachys]|uniref:Uncharacterized protein n=1 Tax=Diploscapter pachys TaxID=2018661 RepID=A0A2A2LS19_9BILA|nr:hypothetical protein WR25_14969 [Diploscapter pachys]